MIKQKTFLVNGSRLTRLQWLKKMYCALEAILKYQDDLAWNDDQGKYQIIYTLSIEKV